MLTIFTLARSNFFGCKFAYAGDFGGPYKAEDSSDHL